MQKPIFVTYLGHNLVNGVYYICQEMSCVKTSGLGVTLALYVFFHHFVVKEPNTFSHVTEIASLTPDTEIENKIYDAAGNCWRCGHGGIHL